MKTIYRNYYEEKESLIRNGYGFLHDKFHQFKITDCLKNEELNKLNPKVMFFKYPYVMGILSFSDEYAYSISFGLIFEKSLLSPKVSIDGMMFK